MGVLAFSVKIWTQLGNAGKISMALNDSVRPNLFPNGELLQQRCFLRISSVVFKLAANVADVHGRCIVSTDTVRYTICAQQLASNPVRGYYYMVARIAPAQIVFPIVLNCFNRCALIGCGTMYY